MSPKKHDGSLLGKLEKEFSSFTPSQQKIARYLLTNSDMASYLVVDELSSKCRTTSATVVRFAKHLGYKGYPDLQADLRNLVLEKIKVVGQLEKAKRYGLPEKQTASYHAISNDIANLETLTQNLNENEINRFVDLVLDAKMVYIMADRGAYSVGHYFYYQSNKILSNVHLINQVGLDPYDTIENIAPEDVVIGISFPRYSRKTFEFLSYLKKSKKRVISITDSKTSPLYALSEACLFCPYEGVTYATSAVAPMAIVNALIAELFTRLRPNAIVRLERTEETIKDNKILIITDVLVRKSRHKKKSIK